MFVVISHIPTLERLSPNLKFSNLSRPDIEYPLFLINNLNCLKKVFIPFNNKFKFTTDLVKVKCWLI